MKGRAQQSGDEEKRISYTHVPAEPSYTPHTCPALVFRNEQSLSYHMSHLDTALPNRYTQSLDTIHEFFMIKYDSLKVGRISINHSSSVFLWSIVRQRSVRPACRNSLIRKTHKLLLLHPEFLNPPCSFPLGDVVA